MHTYKEIALSERINSSIGKVEVLRRRCPSERVSAKFELALLCTFIRNFASHLSGLHKRSPFRDCIGPFTGRRLSRANMLIYGSRSRAAATIIIPRLILAQAMWSIVNSLEFFIHGSPCIIDRPNISHRARASGPENYQILSSYRVLLVHV